MLLSVFVFQTKIQKLIRLKLLFALVTVIACYKIIYGQRTFVFVNISNLGTMEVDYFSKIRFCSYNCNSVRSKIDMIREILSECDVLLLQEIIILDEDKKIFNGIDREFDVHVMPSRLSISNNYDGRSSGGLAFMWRKSVGCIINVVASHTHYLLVHMQSNNWSLGVINVYMPHDDRSNTMLGEYSQILGELQASMSEMPLSSFICMGDFNSDPHRGRLWDQVVRFADGNSLVIVDSNLPADTFTYLSPAHNTTSWLDHVLATHDLDVSNLRVQYDKAIFDHFPVAFNLNVKCNSSSINSGCQKYVSGGFVKWETVNRHDYVNNVESLISSLCICDNIDCEIDHREAIDVNYDVIISSMLKCTEKYLFKDKCNYVQVPGWNIYCRTKYKCAREAFMKWLRCGKIRFGQFYDEMKLTRKSFIAALKYCKRNREKISNDALASSFYGKDVNTFWKEVGKRQPSNRIGVTEIDGLTNSNEIAMLFESKFKMVTGSTADGLTENNYNFCPNTSFSKRFNSNQIKRALSQLNDGIGFDGIHSNHLKYTSPVISHILSRFINSCFIHNHFPDKMLAAVIRPLVKDKSGNVKNSDNYREVMISTNFFKLIENLLLPYLEKIKLNVHQFAYRKNTSTTLANTIFREAIGCNIDGEGTIYTCPLDLSKAFERVDHQTLIKK